MFTSFNAEYVHVFINKTSWLKIKNIISLQLSRQFQNSIQKSDSDSWNIFNVLIIVFSSLNAQKKNPKMLVC